MYLEYDGMKTTALFDLANDPLQKKNLAGTVPAVQGRLEHFIMAYLQQYNNRLIENRMVVEE
jgi:hypothetical protein